MAIEKNDDRIQEWLDSAMQENNPQSFSDPSAEEKKYRKLYHLLCYDDTPSLSSDFNIKLQQRVENYHQVRNLWGLILAILGFAIVLIATLVFTGGTPLLAQWQNQLSIWISPFLGSLKFDYFSIFREAFSSFNISLSALFLAGLAIIVVFLFDELIFQKKKRLQHSVDIFRI